MNTLKNVLASLAFVFAIGAAFATSTALTTQAKGVHSRSPCLSGTLTSNRSIANLLGSQHCWTMDRGNGRCQVTVDPIDEDAEVVPAFVFNSVCILSTNKLYIQ